MARNRKWTEQEQLILEREWQRGTDIGQIAKLVRRSREAVRLRAHLTKCGKRAPNMLSLSEVARRTGMCREAVKAVAKHLGLLPRRMHMHGHRKTKIAEEDVPKIVEAHQPRKRNSVWGEVTHPQRGASGSKRSRKLPDACLACRETDRPHAGNGLCTRCHQHKRYWANREAECAAKRARWWKRKLDKRLDATALDRWVDDGGSQV